MAAPVFIARRDPRLRARIMSEKPLAFAAESSATAARGAGAQGVGSGSKITSHGDQMFVIHDGAESVAVIDGSGPDAPVSGMRLKAPVGAVRGRGEIRLQVDAVMAARDWRGGFLLAFGSGANAERRTVARVRLSGGDTELSLFSAQRFYESLDELPELATTTLHLAGAALLPKGVEGRDGVRVFHRGGGPPRSPGWASDGRGLPASCDFRLDSLLAYLDRCKRDPVATLGFEIGSVRRYDLDEFEGVAFTLADAAAMPDSEPGRVAFLAVAERPAPDGETQPQCVGLSMAVIDPDGTARYTLLVERDGEPSRRRVRGLTLTSAKTAYLVVDPADAERPALLCTVDLSGV